jgi:replicative DNA helicase
VSGFDGDSFEASSLASPEAEAAIIGSLLLDPQALDRVADALTPAMFADPVHMEVFGEMVRQHTAGKPVDVMSVFLGLGNRVPLVQINGLSQYVSSSANLRRYVEVVRERAGSRALVSVGNQLMLLAVEHDRALEDRIDQAQGELMKLAADGRPDDEWVAADAGMVEHLAVLEDRAEGKTNAMATGLADLDDILEGGLRPGELVIIGARPSMGKTALAMTIGLHMARDWSVAMLSMEMPHVELRDRMTAMLGRVSLGSVKRPAKGAGLEWDRVVEGIEAAKLLSFRVTDKGGLNINQVRSKARAIKRQHGLHVLLVDYIGLMSGLDARQPRAYQLEEISRGLKTLAKELGVAVVCLAQVNRKVEERADSTPSLSDLRDSGAIEQDADVVIFVHRPIQARPDLGDEFKGYAKVSVAKNRNGRCGVFSLYYQGDQTRFSAWSGEPPAGRSVKARGGDL